MTIEQYFNTAFVINLNRRPDRMEDFRADMSTAGIAPDFITRWEAFDNPEHGHAGCTRSHRELIRAIADGEWNKVLIFEDDCSPITATALKEHGFTPDSIVWKRFASIDGMNVNQKFSAMTKFIPDDWDVLYLGGSYGENPVRRINQRVIKTGLIQTTTAYGITREYAKRWSDLIDSQCDISGFPGPIDNLLCTEAKDRNFYILQPRLFFQRKSYSDLSGTNVSHFNSMSDPVHESSV
jgi:GR25 family glycosyltransferase involved in LPS biosynthesis